MLVEVEDQVVGHDRVAGGEEGHQAVDQVLLGRHELAVEIGQVVGEVDLLDGPGVLDRIAVHVEELRVTHRAQRQVEPGIENVGLGPRWRRVVGRALLAERGCRGGVEKAGRRVPSVAGLAGLGVLQRAGDGLFVGEGRLRCAVGASGRTASEPPAVAWLIRVAGRLRR